MTVHGAHGGGGGGNLHCFDGGGDHAQSGDGDVHQGGHSGGGGGGVHVRRGGGEAHHNGQRLLSSLSFSKLYPWT